MKYKVQRGIIIAAGFGSRMYPITKETPKPLLDVNGIRFIDSIIDKMLQAGIKEIYIVRGYLKEKFDILLDKYPFLHFIDNDLYNKENNISSAMKILNLLENAYICDADFLIYGNDVFVPYQDESNYLATPVDQTDDWCFDVDQNGNLRNYRKGGTNCYQAFCIAYFTPQDARKLKKCLIKMYNDKNNRQKYWEMCVFDNYKEKFNIKYRHVNPHSIREFDTVDELISVDSKYARYKL